MFNLFKKRKTEKSWNEDIHFQKIDLPFKSEPNTAVPLVEVHNTDVLLGFNSCELSDFDFRNTKIRHINFLDCLMYREGHPNDDGFYLFGAYPRINNDSIYSQKAFPDLDFDTFYKVVGVDWKNNLLGNGTKIINDQYKEKEGFTHFVFFMKNGTFECVAKEYKINHIEKVTSYENHSVTLYKASIKDIPILLELEKSVSGTNVYSPMLDENEWKEEFNKGEIYLIKKGEAVVGNVSYELRPDDSVYISGLVINPSFQGQGIAREVLVKLLEEFKNIKRIDLVTHPNNHTALNLYQSLGFVIESRYDNYYGDGEPRLRLVLQK